MKQPIQVVMLPTEDEGVIMSHVGPYDTDMILISELPKISKGHERPHNHLYITVSQDVEPIKKGDWQIDSKNRITKFTSISMNLLGETYRKIIATTDPKLTIQHQTSQGNLYNEPIPQVQQSFLKEFVSNPNSKWEVEYEKISRFDVFNMKAEEINKLSTMYKLKLNQDNTVNITPIEEKMYNKAEFIKGVLKMQHDYTKYKEKCHYGPNMREIAEWTDNWIKENLK